MAHVNSPNPAQRLIVALDFSDLDQARRCIDELEGVVSFYKIGLELFLASTGDFLKAMGYPSMK